MEATLVSAATGALKPVLGKLATLVGDEYRRFKEARGEIKSLTHELAAMDAFLEKMSEEEDPDVQDRVWMNEVRELSYDMEDSIDDFMQQVDNKDTKPDGFMEKIKNSLGKMKARRRIGKEIEGLKKQIVEVAERNARYKTRETFSKTTNATVDPRALAMFEHASKLVGIDEPKREIIKLLTKEDVSVAAQEQLKLVSIVGPGGMGKTTLANQVYQELKGQFQCGAFLSVSRNPDEMNILRTILSEVNGRGYAETEAGSMQPLIGKISDFLSVKRYFIVIDDIWDVTTWDVIKCALPVNSCGSRIITTTRINNVAESCRSSFNGDIYSIRPLNVVHSRQLFNRRLFNFKEDCPSYLEEVSVRILEKCGGLPLAIIAISGLLANTERTKCLWNQVKDSIGRALERNPDVEGMMKILSLSYFDLPPCLKTCLLYLSIFPEDSIIVKKDLIRRWVAEGFIQKEGRYTVHEIGERCFNELLNRSLIQPARRNVYGEAPKQACRVHDIILDFIISKSIEENFVTLVGVPNLIARTQGKVRRLSIYAGKKGNSSITTGPFSHVRSFSLSGDSVEIPSLDEFRHLRALNFEGCGQLKDRHLVNIGGLFQLRYLNLRTTTVRNLPEEIGHVRCLEMLDLRDTEVRQLPAAIVNLRKLSHLLVDYGVEFPDGIAKMQALEVLKHVGLSTHPFDLMQDLGQLKNLRKLDLVVRTYDDNGLRGIVEEKCHKDVFSPFRNQGTQSLHSLTIWDGSIFLQQEGSLCPVPFTLQKLNIDGPSFSSLRQVPKWMCSLVNLQKLFLAMEGVGREDVCILGALPSLLILILKVRPADRRTMPVKGNLVFSGAVGFRCLRIFSHSRFYGPVGLVFAAGSMPKLEELKIFFDACEELPLTTSGAIDIGIENLPCLITVKCQIKAYIDSSNEAEKAAMAMERAVSTHPNHPTLLFERLYNY